MIAIYRRFTNERIKLIAKDFITMESVAIELLSDKECIEEFVVFTYDTRQELKDKESQYNLRLL